MIKLLRFSQCVKFFENGFAQRWDLTPMYIPTEPTVFVGAYTIDDIKTILEHKSHKIVMLLGADMPNISKLKHDKSITFASDKQLNLDIFAENGVKHFDGIIPLKSFDAFKRTEKGDKPYCYINTSNDNNKFKHRYDLASKFNPIVGVHGKTQDEVINDYYKPSFVNLQLNPFAGFTSAIEMAYMGRRSVSNSPAPFSRPFNTEADIKRIIDEERDNNWNVDLIGNYLHNENDWLNV